MPPTNAPNTPPAPNAPSPAGDAPAIRPSGAAVPAPAPAGPKLPHRVGKHGALTRAGMIDVIRRGGSVLHNGRQYTHESQVPADADLVTDDAEHNATVKADLQRTIAEQQRQLDALNAAEAERKKQAADAAKQSGGDANQPPAAKK